MTARTKGNGLTGCSVSEDGIGSSKLKGRLGRRYRKILARESEGATSEDIEKEFGVHDDAVVLWRSIKYHALPKEEKKTLTALDHIKWDAVARARKKRNKNKRNKNKKGKDEHK